MKFLFNILPVFLAIPSACLGVQSESTDPKLVVRESKVQSVTNAVPNKNRKRKAQEQTDSSSDEYHTTTTSWNHEKGCSKNKQVRIYGFCINGDHDEGDYGEHRMYLDGGFMDPYDCNTDDGPEYGTDRKEGECEWLWDADYAKNVEYTNYYLGVGTREFDADGYEDFIHEMKLSEWYDETCGTYDIELSMKFSGENDVSSCWQRGSDYWGNDEPQHLDIPHCSLIETLGDSFTWHIEISPANTQKMDWPTGWTDSHGDGCDWYASNPDHCADYGGILDLENHGYVANEACVVCGGGVEYNGKVDFPFGWTDSVGDGCEWYAEHPDNCQENGHHNKNHDYTAEEVCAVCGGGVQRDEVWFNGKTDFPLGWHDSYGHSCTWYRNHSDNCVSYGHLYHNQGYSANAACVTCGGGVFSNGRTDFPKSWTDANGKDCEWYNEHPDHCPDYAHLHENNGYTAELACAVCGGGVYVI